MKKEKRPAVQQAAAQEKIPFEELIAGEYAKEFRRKEEEIRAAMRGDPRAAYEALLRSAQEAQAAYPDFDFEDEIKVLLKTLAEVENHGTCPHGRPVAMELSKKELDKQFERT